MINKNFFEIENVDFYVGGKAKVKDVSFKIENEGDIICLLGPSGIGKTTILRTIAGSEKIDNGSITLNGRIISSNEVNIEPENRNIALSFQDNSLFPNYKVIDNINFGKKRSNGNGFSYEAEDIIKLLHIEPILEKFPHQISAGEAQRVSLARSLMSDRKSTRLNSSHSQQSRMPSSA